MRIEDQNQQSDLHSIDEHKKEDVTSSKSISVTAYQDIPQENLIERKNERKL